MWRLICKKNVTKFNSAAGFFARNFADAHKTAASPFALPSEPSTTSISKPEEKLPFSNIVSKTEMVVNQRPDVSLKVQEEDLHKPIPFDEVPGPTALRYISKIWSVIPIFGNQVTTSTLQYVLSAGSQISWGNNLALFRYLLNEYGPVVRLHGPFGGDVVILSRPEHASVVFQNEGPYPIRSSLDCVEKYRLQYRLYRQAGPFSMHGPEWETLRKSIEPALEQSLNYQCDRIAKTCDNFVGRTMVIRNRQLEVPKSYKEELNKWCLECLCGIMFNKNLGFLDTKGLSSTAETSILLDSLSEATHAIRKCEFGLHMWKFFETPAWKRLVQNCDTIDHILGSYLKKSQEKLRERKEKNLETKPEDVSLIDCFLVKDSMVVEDILTVLLDMMLLGVNMTTHSAAFMMYHLARNPRVQHNLYQEISKLPENLTRDDLNNLPYLKACLHESLRLKPPMPVLSRILTKDITVHGYRIPKGTFMLIATNLSSLREEHFEDALKFKPERWLGMEVNKDMEALATIPFGLGPKACLAKNLAEVQICFLIIKMLRKFRIEYHYGDIESNNQLLAAPTRPLKFRLVDRLDG
ncbi:PREDICTED: cytochrome P450 CYP12A2-like [Nicrophorus vespilloides]|uniref:Cytochrome P450 CYP12A2-like n=1 Tax=Nicrophorus vespilloides TaxID=110193 RepID=A0ABM1NAP4_NICVS|nr:PREDICTED: cytochrome P450 CYP12A2-like [Nicrophorus vespilloides]